MVVVSESNIDIIIKYLEKNGIFYVNDLLITYYSIFLIPYEDFINRFELIKEELGSDFQDKLEKDNSLILKVFKGI